MDRSVLLSQLEEYKKNNGKKYGILVMGVFGSVARGQANQFSDVDIVVKMQTADPYIIVHMKEELEGQLRMPVDIVRVRDKMNRFLKDRIEKEAIYVQ